MNKETEIAIDKITIAVSNSDKMAKFYSDIFEIKFQTIAVENDTLYRGKIGKMTMLLCPKSLAGIKADQNTIQLRFVVSNVREACKKGTNRGGVLLEDIQENNGNVYASLRDPDGNSLELVEFNNYN